MVETMRQRSICREGGLSQEENYGTNRDTSCTLFIDMSHHT